MKNNSKTPTRVVGYERRSKISSLQLSLLKQQSVIDVIGIFYEEIGIGHRWTFGASMSAHLKTL